MKTVFLLLTLLMLSAAAAQPTYTSDDIQRVLRIKNSRGRLDGKNLVVLDRILPDGRLKCRYIGTRQQITLNANQTEPSVFYEDSSDFMITQYVLQNSFASAPNYLPRQLAQLKGDKTGRISKLQALENELKNFTGKLIQIRNEHADDRDDQLDAFASLLDEAVFNDILISSVGMQDWLLTIVLFEKYHSTVLSLTMRYLPYEPIQQEMHSKLEKQKKELVEKFTLHIKNNNVRRGQFRKKYPAAAGLWSRTAPADYRELKYFFSQSMESYMRLEKISKIFSPQDWGSAMLDVLLMTEGSPGAVELETEFDNTMRSIPGNDQQ